MRKQMKPRSKVTKLLSDLAIGEAVIIEDSEFSRKTIVGYFKRSACLENMKFSTKDVLIVFAGLEAIKATRIMRII